MPGRRLFIILSLVALAAAGLALAAIPTRAIAAPPRSPPLGPAGPGAAAPASPRGALATPVPQCPGAWQVIAGSALSATQDSRLFAVAVVAAADVWAVGDYRNANDSGQALARHWDGRHWRRVTLPDVSGANSSLYSVAAVATDNVWTVGEIHTAQGDRTLAGHWDGRTWRVVPTPNVNGAAYNALHGVSAASPDDVWAVGSYGNPGSSFTLVEHWDGGQWRIVPSPDAGPQINRLVAVSARAGGDAWAVGEYHDAIGATVPLVEHWNGTTWQITPSSNITGSTLTAVSARAPNDVWAVGTEDGRDLVLHGNSGTWIRVQGPRAPGAAVYLQGVAAVTPDAVWVVGETDDVSGAPHLLVARYDGAGWAVLPVSDPGAFSTLNGIAAGPEGRLWAVGSTNGAALTERYGGSCGGGALPTSGNGALIGWAALLAGLGLVLAGTGWRLARHRHETGS